MYGLRIAGFAPIDWLAAAFSTPLTSLVLAMIAVGGYVAFTGSGRHAPMVLHGAAERSVNKRYAHERRALAISALAVVAVFAAEDIVRGSALHADGAVSWWRFATPVVSSALAVGVLAAVITRRGSGPAEAAVMTGARRTWTTFGPRVGLILCGVVSVFLIATTIGAGLTSSADDRGQHIWLEIPIPNEAAIDPIRLGYYGWAFGAPVLIAVAALLVTTVIALRRNAARPFIRPETVAAERGLRADVASGAVALSTAGMLLAMGGAWRLIARAGSPAQLWIDGQNGGEPYDATWRYAELASVAGWAAPILELIAFGLLFVVAAKMGKKRPSSPDARIDELADAAGTGR